jgi:hypothetical protein
MHRVLVVGMLALAPVSLMPDAAWGASGELRAVDYPASYAEARGVVGDADGSEVLVLPFSSYRAPAWNHGHKVLSPIGRYLSPDQVASDELFVSGRLVRGEDPRGDDVRAALDEGLPDARAAALAELGIGVVVTERDAPGEVPEITGTVLQDDPLLLVLQLAEPHERRIPDSWWAAMGAAWAVYAGMLLGGLVGVLRHRFAPIPASM